MKEKKIQEIQEKCTTNLENTLFRFFIAREKNELYCISIKDQEYISGGWLPTFAIQLPGIGGSSGARRIRDIKGDPEKCYRGCGIPFEQKSHKWETREGEKKSTPIYRLAVDLTYEQWQKFLKDGYNYIYEPPEKQLEIGGLINESK